MVRREGAPEAPKWTVALAGNPNVGKSTLFNSLTGLNQHTGNWPGKTVAVARGYMEYRGSQIQLVDLPGTQSLNSRSPEEQVAEDYIASGEADCIAVVCDGSCLERNLILALQVMARHRKVILCVNLMDEAARCGVEVKAGELERQLGIPVVMMSAGTGKGLGQFKETLRGTLEDFLPCRTVGLPRNAPMADYVRRAEEIAGRAVSGGESAYKKRQRRLDQILTRPAVGTLLLFILLMGIVWLTIVGANYPSDLLQRCFDWGYGVLIRFAARLGLPWWVTGPLFDGVYLTVARVVAVMLPPMAIFFPLFTVLEDVGYLPRAAFLLDRSLSRCGGCGKQALTMAMGLGCNAVGVTGCRIIDSPRERLTAILTNAFMPCNGRFPSLILLGTVFFTGGNDLLGAVLITALLCAGYLATIGVSWGLNRTVLKGKRSAFLLELPPFRKPRLGQILVRSLLDRTLFVAGRAVAVAAPAGLVLWICANVNIGGESLIACLAGFLDPVGAAMGMNGLLLLAFLLALPANELLLPVVVMGLMGVRSLGGELSTEAVKTLLLAGGWTAKTALCTMVFILFHWPCGTTLLTIRKECGSVKWAAVAFILPTVIGVLLCLLLNWIL